MKSAVLDTRLANCPQWYLIPPPDINMRIPSRVKKSVVFIGIKADDSVITEPDYCGTGFIVSIQSSKIKRVSFPYLVTARHVAAELKGLDFYIRVNTKDGKAIVFKVGAGQMKWWFNPKEDEACDVAIFPLGIPQEIFNTMDYEAIKTDMFLTDAEISEQGIGEGDDVFTAGVFYHHQGENKNLPIVRMGNIAMMPDEPIQHKKFGDMEVYLIELRSMSGLSGSPVFVLNQVAGEITEKGLFKTSWHIYLLGLICGHWEKGIDKINVGIAYVAPAKKILETINRKELADIRGALEANYIADKSPVLD
jgi:hypothetical protein